MSASIESNQASADTANAEALSQAKFSRSVSGALRHSLEQECFSAADLREAAVGPVVKVVELGDDRSEPDVEKTLDLRIPGFRGWQDEEFSKLRKAVLRVASLEAGPFQYCGKVSCTDPEYYKALFAYLDSVCDIGESAPLDPLVLDSALAHGFYSSGPEELEAVVLELFTHPSSEIRRHCYTDLHRRLAECGRGGLSRRLSIGQPAYDALLRTLPSLSDNQAATVIELFRHLPDCLDRDPAEAASVVAAAKQSFRSELLDQAVLYAVEHRTEVADSDYDAIMRRKSSKSLLKGYPAGIAAGHVLSRDPKDVLFRQSVQDALISGVLWVGPGVSGSREHSYDEFTCGLLSSRQPEAVALAMNHIGGDVGHHYIGHKPSAGWRWLWRKLCGCDTAVNDIMYHLDSDFYSDAAEAGVRALAKHGGKIGRRYLERQLSDPPNSTRRSMVESALSEILSER